MILSVTDFFCAMADGVCNADMIKAAIVNVVRVRFISKSFQKLLPDVDFCDFSVYKLVPVLGVVESFLEEGLGFFCIELVL